METHIKADGQYNDLVGNPNIEHDGALHMKTAPYYQQLLNSRTTLLGAISSMYTGRRTSNDISYVLES